MGQAWRISPLGVCIELLAEAAYFGTYPSPSAGQRHERYMPSSDSPVSELCLLCSDARPRFAADRRDLLGVDPVARPAAHSYTSLKVAAGSNRFLSRRAGCSM